MYVNIMWHLWRQHDDKINDKFLRFAFVIQINCDIALFCPIILFARLLNEKKDLFSFEFILLETRLFLRHNSLRRNEFQSDRVNLVSSKIFVCQSRNLLAVLFFLFFT